MSLVVAPLVALPASANTDGTGVIINEAYLSGGSAGSAYKNKFVELYNPTDAAITLDGTSIQYRSPTGKVNPTGVVELTGSIPANGYFLVGGGSNVATSTSPALPAPDVDSNAGWGGTNGTIFFADQTDPLTEPAVGSQIDNPLIIDLLGYGSSNTFETVAASSPSGTGDVRSFNRTDFVDSDDNSADFTLSATITPTNSTSGSTPEPTGTPTPTSTSTPSATPTSTPTAEPTETPAPTDVTPIDAIQGTTDISPFAGQAVKTVGVVTAAYPGGGFNGFYIQSPDTGGPIDLETHTASDGIFVYGTAATASVAIGDYVSVVGKVSEYYNLTEISVASASDVEQLDDNGIVDPIAATVTLPETEAARESLEGMLLAPQGDFTVTNNYTTNRYAEIGLAAGTTPLVNPTVTNVPGSDGYTAAIAANAARAVTLDDGASTDYLYSDAENTAVPYLSTTEPVRIGAAVTFTKPVIFDYRFEVWKFQPTTALVAGNADTVQPVTFENDRTDAPEDVGGDIRLASFNVLNYFSTTGDSLNGCNYYSDRAGDPTTVSGGCDARGAADAENFERQQAKIVAAINALDADVVSLEEIENSAAFGKDRDDALQNLVTALNADAGSAVWDFAGTPDALPTSEDVIRTAFIFKPATVELVGDSVILAESEAFNGRAREPLAQAFQQVGDDSSSFLAIANHFKSKGSGSGVDDDQGDGQGKSNATRVEQAEALVAFAAELKTDTGIDRVFLMGDFNAYDLEDPLQVLLTAGYINQGATTGEYTYAFGGTVGSLDHVFASPEADAAVNDVDVWNINSVESVALEYSRYNNNLTDFYTPDAFRSSDHDPVVLGLNLSNRTDINLLNINDFHGRIDDNTVRFAGTIDSLRAEYGDDATLFLSSGDNIGASLFASSSQLDVPTIDALNALGLKTSAVGNHEFDQGFDDLTGRVTDAADFSHLGANVYLQGTTTPAMDEYAIFDVDGVQVAVIGAVTQETPALVSPNGIASLSFGDPVEAVNRVAATLTDGNPANGEADVIVAEYHEGAGAGTVENATLAQELALTDSAFERIVNDTSADVSAIFTGHTHKQYAWDAQVPGAADGVTRPVLQTGSYGENVGQVVLSYDPESGDTTTVVNKNVKRLVGTHTVTGTSAEVAAAQKAADAALNVSLIAAYPRVEIVDGIVKAALEQAAILGDVPVGSLTADISRACLVAGIATCSEDRSAPSAMGTLVANSLRESLSSDLRGGAEIGIVNPGGMRTDLTVGDDGVITYADANAVLPFLNNLWTTTLTGAQFKTVLEQQWQRTALNVVPSRPYLQLGLSDNVNYTFDASRAEGDRITGIWVDGVAVDAEQPYRIGSFNFLLTGGDNFHEFKNGTATVDSGLVDRDAWIDYIKAESPLSPSFAVNQASVTGAPTIAVAPGDTVNFTVADVDLSSLGAPANTEFSVEWVGSSTNPGSASVDASGVFPVSVTVPADATENSVILLTSAATGTVVRVPITVDTTVIAPTPTPTPTDGTTPVVPKPSATVLPTIAPVSAAASVLVPSLEDVIDTAEGIDTAGETITIDVGVEYAGQFVSVWMRSVPVNLGSWLQVSAQGFVTVTIPANTAAGTHRIIVQDATGAVIGWTEIQVAAAASSTASLPSMGIDATPGLFAGALLLLLGAVLMMHRRRGGIAQI
ncbi:ExeM/NucH family extracellular endonuclease [Cryobacterium melibiosiphilum]|uniref:ExeM/NucH family extracellular endonuclease n=1 Tax=Cryobacterium melibiosiphilum TaxID=995039 RepID=UPI001F1D4EB4|nr:ExeM/NucH family extracellular endonuclease [Cryobacterium melibiosiphilum]